APGSPRGPGARLARPPPVALASPGRPSQGPGGGGLGPTRPDGRGDRPRPTFTLSSPGGFATDLPGPPVATLAAGGIHSNPAGSLARLLGRLALVEPDRRADLDQRPRMAGHRALDEHQALLLV